MFIEEAFQRLVCWDEYAVQTTLRPAVLVALVWVGILHQLLKLTASHAHGVDGAAHKCLAHNPTPYNKASAVDSPEVLQVAGFPLTCLIHQQPVQLASVIGVCRGVLVVDYRVKSFIPLYRPRLLCHTLGRCTERQLCPRIGSAIEYRSCPPRHIPKAIHHLGNENYVLGIVSRLAHNTQVLILHLRAVIEKNGCRHIRVTRTPTLSKHLPHTPAVSDASLPVQVELPLKLQKISMPNIQLVVGEHEVVVARDVCGVSIIHKPYPLPSPTEVLSNYL